MPTGFLPHLTAALLAAHTLLGCCWHHAHACGRECEPASSVHASDAPEADDAHRCGADNSQSGQHRGLNECRGSSCVFLRTSECELDGDQFDLPALACLDAGGSPLCAAAVLQPRFAADALLPPLRLHLAHQVLLL
jgi:hypothetical protein